jgi:osmotically-inducible protein OsmY
MYILDPSAGRNRRKTAVEKAGKLRRKSGALGRASRDIGKEAWGLLAEAQSAFGGEELVVDDAILADRVRERLSRAVSRPGAVQVGVQDGVVTLTGSVPAVEFDPLVSAVIRVRGVRDLNDQLDVRPIEDGARDFEDSAAE